MKKNTKPPPEEQFVALRFPMMKSPAWRTMSTSARIYYLQLKSGWFEKPKNNNGEIFLSLRDAEEAIGLTRPTIAKCHDELIHYGFIVETNPGCLGVDGKGRAPHLRLTELDTTDKPATKDYLRWNGKRFRPRQGPAPGSSRRPRKTKPRPNNLATLAN
jgi:hypothetical protein